MKKMFVLLFAVLLSGALSGCGSASAAKDQIAAVNEMASILEGVKDDKSAEEALPKLEKAADKARAAGEKVASGGAMSESEATKFSREMGEALSKMQSAAMKAASAAKGKSKQITETLAKAQPKNVK
jgi:curli biogenesis system outer membrane secretion channel CsgG